MKARKLKNFNTRDIMKQYDWKEKCPTSCPFHKTETHNSCFICPACKNSPHVPKLYKQKSWIKKNNRYAEREIPLNEKLGGE